MARRVGLRRLLPVAVLAAALSMAALPGARADGVSTPVASSVAWDFPDPFVLPVSAFGTTTWFAYATTNSLATNIAVASSSDLQAWQPRGDALPVLPPWARRGQTWAPSVLNVRGRYMLFYAVQEASTHRHCISVAESAWPEGPYVDGSMRGLVCAEDTAGAIDPSPLVDAAGQPWLIWTTMGRTGQPGSLWSQRLAGDARALVGPRTRILIASQPWEAGVVEAPSMYRVGHEYHLLYSGNYWGSPSYGVGWARCATPAGPCRRGTNRSVLVSGPLGQGPGSLEVFPDGHGYGVAYHAWDGPVGYPHGRRTLRIARLMLGPRAAPAFVAR